MTIFRFALLRKLRDPALMALLCVLPVAIVFLPSPPGLALPIGFHVYEIVLMFTAFLMIRTVVEDRESGVFLRIGAAPVTHFRYLLETLLAFTLMLLVQNALVVTIGRLAHGEELPPPLPMFAAYAVFSLTSIALNLAACSAFRLREAAYGASSTLIIVLSVLGGGYWPVDLMPPALQRVAMVTPTYWLFDALSLAGTAGSGPRFALSLGIMVLYAVIFLIAGSRRRIV